MTDSDYQIIGKLAAVHGLKGFLKIDSYTRPAIQILDYPQWWIRLPRHAQWQSLDIEKFTQLSSSRLMVKFVGIDDRTAAEKYKAADIAITKDQMPDLQDDEYYWHELIGLKVSNQEGQFFGVISELLETGANDVLVIQTDEEAIKLIPDSKESKLQILIPYVPEYVSAVDLENQKMTVDWQLDY